jgi:hypothetical protein
LQDDIIPFHNLYTSRLLWHKNDRHVIIYVAPSMRGCWVSAGYPLAKLQSSRPLWSFGPDYTLGTYMLYAQLSPVVYLLNTSGFNCPDDVNNFFMLLLFHCNSDAQQLPPVEQRPQRVVPDNSQLRTRVMPTLDYRLSSLAW